MTVNPLSMTESGRVECHCRPWAGLVARAVALAELAEDREPLGSEQGVSLV